MAYRKGESHVLREPRASTGGFEAFKESISLQLAARAARLAEESPSLGTRSASAAPDITGSKQENRQNNLEKQVSPSRLFIWGLGFAVGITVSAGVMYFFLGMNLRPPLPSPSVLAAAPTLPSPSATADAPPLTTPPLTTPPLTTPPLPAPAKVDTTAALQPPPSAAALVISIAPKPSVLTPSQTKLSPPEILEVQTRLESLGMKPGPLDGVFGPLLATAIRRYEETKGRPQIGNVDREVLERLRQETNESISQVPTQRSTQP
jgi:Putative peptidoglycan binding domain